MANFSHPRVKSFQKNTLRGYEIQTTKKLNLSYNTEIIILNSITIIIKNLLF